jgi:hypothetical protein
VVVDKWQHAFAVAARHRHVGQRIVLMLAEILGGGPGQEVEGDALLLVADVRVGQRLERHGIAQDLLDHGAQFHALIVSVTRKALGATLHMPKARPCRARRLRQPVPKMVRSLSAPLRWYNTTGYFIACETLTAWTLR